MRPKLIALGMICILFVVGEAYAQTPVASLTGRISDPSGKVILDAKVVAISTSTNARYEGETNRDGYYYITSLPPGTYQMEIEKPGFKTLIEPGVVLHIQDTVEVNFEMALGSISEIVTVEAVAPHVNTTDGSVGTVISQELVQNLPLNGRTFQSLLTLTPGVNQTSSNSGMGTLTVNGQRATANNYTVDGVSANTDFSPQSAGGTRPGTNALGGTNNLVSVEALQEFRVETSSYPPEFGRNPGGQVILLTRSGTNDFHGSLYEYFRNDKLDAADWFENQAGQPKPPLRFNDFGGVFGGPIIKNRTFFFFSYEGQRLRQPVFIISTVPSMDSRAAAPASTQPILEAFPIPNGPVGQNGTAVASYGASNPGTTNATSLRVDHIFSPKVWTFIRYSYSPSSTAVRASGWESLNTVQSFDYSGQTVTAGLTAQLSPITVNELRFNFSTNRIKDSMRTDTLGGAKPLPDSLLFIPPYTRQNSNVEFNFYYSGSFLADGTFDNITQRQFNIVDGLSRVFGKHTIKVGVDYRRFLPVYNGQQAVLYFYNGIPGVISDSTAYAGVQAQARAHVSVPNYSVYAQDSWKPLPRLSLTYGLRWEVTPAPHTLGGPNQYVPLVGDFSNPSTLGDVHVGTLGAELWPTTYNNIAPRFGLAYSASQTPGRELVFRGGVGVFYDTGTGMAALQPFYQSYPNTNSLNYSGTTFPFTASQVTLPPPSTTPGPGTWFAIFSPDLKLPYTVEWNVSAQKSLGASQDVTAAYVASTGRRLLFASGIPYLTNLNYNGVYTTNKGSSDYESLQLQYRRHISHGLAAIVSYTWGHSIDTGSSDVGIGIPTTYLSAASNRGDSDFDIRHSLYAALTYEISNVAKHSWARSLVNGWAIDSIIAVRTATPVTVYTQREIGIGYYGGLRPDLVPGVPLYLSNPNVGGGREFNPAAFSIPTDIRQGTLGRNTLRGFGMSQVDLSIARNFRLKEKLNLQFRGDLFNVLNHPNFGDPSGDLDPWNLQFGRSTQMLNHWLGQGGPNGGLNPLFQVGGPREVQLSLKLVF